MTKHPTTWAPMSRLQSLPKVHRELPTTRMKIGTGFVTPTVVERPAVTAASTSISSSTLSFFISLPAFFALPLQTKARQPLPFPQETVRSGIQVRFCKGLSHLTSPTALCPISSDLLTDFQVFWHLLIFARLVFIPHVEM